MRVKNLTIMDLLNKQLFLFLFFSVYFCAPNSFAKDQSGANLGYGAYQRLNAPINPQSGVNNWLNLDLQMKNGASRFTTHLEGAVRFYYNDQDYQYSVPQAFMSYSTYRDQVSIGRKLVTWSPFDAYWGLGVVNSMQGISLLGSKQEGLVGLHWDHSFLSGIDLSFFGSMLYVPSMNPKIECVDGKVKSKAEWVKLPPTKTVVNEKMLPLYYTLDRPKTDDVVLQESLGLRLAKNWKSGAISSFVLYKPENVLRNNADAFLARDYEKVMVRVRPQVNHHIVYGMDAHQMIGRVGINSGVTVIDPNGDLKASMIPDGPVLMENDRTNFETEYYKIEPSYQRQGYFHLASNLRNDILGVSLNYLHLLTDYDNKTSFGEGAKWKRAVGLSCDYDFTDNFNVLLDLKYDLSVRDNVLKHEYSYRFASAVTWAMGVEVLRAPRNDSYWSSYRSNDTLYSNLGYRF